MMAYVEKCSKAFFHVPEVLDKFKTVMADFYSGTTDISQSLLRVVGLFNECGYLELISTMSDILPPGYRVKIEQVDGTKTIVVKGSRDEAIEQDILCWRERVNNDDPPPDDVDVPPGSECEIEGVQVTIDVPRDFVHCEIEGVKVTIN